VRIVKNQGKWNEERGRGKDTGWGLLYADNKKYLRRYKHFYLCFLICRACRTTTITTTGPPYNPLPSSCVLRPLSWVLLMPHSFHRLLLSPSAIAPYEHFSNVLHRKCLLCFLLRTISLAATTTIITITTTTIRWKTTAGIKQSEWQFEKDNQERQRQQGRGRGRERGECPLAAKVTF